MKRRNGPLFRFLAVTVTAFAAACASAPVEETAPEAGAAAGGTVINVNNNHTSFTDATIFIVEDATGSRQPLGPVPPGESRTFSFGGPRGWYRLVAQRAAGDIVSDRFNLPNNARVDWMTNQRRVTVRTR